MTHYLHYHQQGQRETKHASRSRLRGVLSLCPLWLLEVGSPHPAPALPSPYCLPHTLVIISKSFWLHPRCREPEDV